MSLSPFTLWSDSARKRFFLLPDDKALPPGEFTLRTLTGRNMRVDPAALAEFEISEPEAKEWLKGEFGKLLDETRAAIDRLTGKLREGPPDPAGNNTADDL